MLLQKNKSAAGKFLAADFIFKQDKHKQNYAAGGIPLGAI